MKLTGTLTHPRQPEQLPITFLGCSIWRDEPGTVWMSQIKYIFHCLRENGWIKEQRVILKKPTTMPTPDEKREDEADVDEDAKSMCQKYIGQLMWLSTRTRPDISACLGILATFLAKRPRECVSCLLHLWRYVYTTSDLAMITAKYDSAYVEDKWYLDSPGERKVPAVVMDHLTKETYAELPVFAPVEPMIVVYCDASFSPNGGRSRSGCSIYLVLPSSSGEGPQHILLSWTSRRQTLTAASAPEAEVAALAESLMPGIVLQDACRVSHIVRSANPILKLNTYTDSAVALRQLRNHKVTVRSRTFANKFHYIRDLCYGTIQHPQAVLLSYCPGTEQRADGQTK
eukprot:6394199-Amphidinium_carterae.1